MNLNYEQIVWTPYIEEMNKIIERINFSEGIGVNQINLNFYHQ